MGMMIDDFGIKQTTGGVFVNQSAGTTESMRPRWFKVTHVGPDQADVSVGDSVLVENGRWSRGIDFDKTGIAENYIYHLDEKAILGVTTG
jgi:hypothetical protein